MVQLVLTTLLAAPGWTADLRPTPALEELTIAGDGAPAGVVRLPPRGVVELTIDGPAAITLRLIGLREKRGLRLRRPGRATVRVDRGKRTILRPKRRARKGWSVEGRPRWVPTRERRTVVEVDEGAHVLQIRLRGARVGMALAVEVERPETVVPAPPEPPPEPPPPPPAPPAPAEAPEEPPLPGPGTEPDEPARDPPAAPPEPSVRLLTRAPQQTIQGPDGRGEFVAASVEQGLLLEVIGPCILVLDLHAHRSNAEAASLRPVIVGVMIDEVLLQTVAVDQAASDDYSTDAPYQVSERVTLRVPVEAGTHELRLTLSDAAVLGMSVRAQLQASTPEPGLLSTTGARAADLRARDPDEVYGTLGVGAIGAAFLPSGLTHFGWMVRGEVDLAIPIAGSRLAIALTGGYLTALEPRTFADRRAPGGRARVNLTLTEVPILAEARWSAPLPSPFGIELGVGGGALLVWTEMRALRAARSDDMAVAPAAVAELTFMLELGPGVITAGGGYILGQPLDTPTLGEFDPGGAWAGLGYRFVIGGD